MRRDRLLPRPACSPPWGPEGGALYPALRFATSFALLLVPTALMGATLPVLTKFVVRRLSDVGIGVGLLYGLNTLGAVAGVVLITFFLMEALGLETSTYAVAAVNFTVAAVAWLIDRRLPVAAAQATEAAAPQRRADSTPAPAGSPVLPGYLLAVVMAGFGLSGFAALGYEVAWLRLLIVTFQANTHYDFSIILIAFLLGISLGSFACSRYLRRGRDLLSLFGVMEILIGLMGHLLRVPLRVVYGVDRVGGAVPLVVAVPSGDVLPRLRHHVRTDPADGGSVPSGQPHQHPRPAAPRPRRR